MDLISWISLSRTGQNEGLISAKKLKTALTMEICGKSPMMNEEATNVVYLSTLLNKQEDVIAHKCDRRCDIEHVWANIYRCKLTGSTHICDKNCNQKIVYDNYSCICRVSHQVFPLTAAEQQAVRGVVRRRVESDFAAESGCASKRRRDAFMHHHQSPFERSFCVVAPICSQPGDSMDIS